MSPEPQNKERESKLKDEGLTVDYSDRPSAKPRSSGSTPAAGKRSTDAMLIGGIVFLVVLFASVMGYIYWKNSQRPLTIEEMHVLNLKGKLDPELGFVYNKVYSFIKYQDQWYTSLASRSGKTHYNFAFRYSPRDVEDVLLTGSLNQALFNNATEYYITFNPTAGNLSYTVLAVNDFNQHMINTFQKLPIAACDRNETDACATRPIITCENAAPTDIVVYIQESSNAAVQLNKNCITLKGNNLDQVKAVDRVLYQFYTIMS